MESIPVDSCEAPITTVQDSFELRIGFLRAKHANEIQQVEIKLLEHMDQAAVNCGRHSGCWLAHRYLERRKQ